MNNLNSPLTSTRRLTMTLIGMSVMYIACGGQNTLTEIKNDTTHLRAQAQVLREEVAFAEDIDSLVVQVDLLNALSQRHLDETLKMRAAMGQRITAIESQLRILETRITESDRQFSELIRKLEGVRAQLNFSGPSESDVSSGQTATQSVDPGELYDLALGDFQRGNYELAVHQFTQYLEYFPDSELADDARYYIGDCYYTQSLYTQALDAYERLLIDYPEGNKAPTALLKIGFVKLARNDHAAARTYLNKVITDFPHSEDAELARLRLELMSDP